MKPIFNLILILVISSPVWSQVPGMAPLPQRAQNKNVLGTMKDGSPAAFIRFSRPQVVHGLSIQQPEDSGIKTDVYMAFEGVTPAKNSETNSLFIRVATERLITATGTFYVELQYFDQGQGGVELTYLSKGDNQEEAIEKTARFYLGDSGHWQRHTFTLQDAVLDHSFPKETDFQIHCPDVPIRQIALSRSPLSTPQMVTSPMFEQPRVSPPQGFFIAVEPEGGSSSGLWKEDTQLIGKSQLYKSWGANHVIDTLSRDRMEMANSRIDLAEYANRAERLRDVRLHWLPRIEVGNPNSLPLQLTSGLQSAVGLLRQGSVNAISMWEPRLVDAYSRLFQALGQNISPRAVPHMILSLSTSWGPLVHDGGWPDVWAGDPLATQDFRQYVRMRYNRVRTVNQAWQTNLFGWNDVRPEIPDMITPSRAIDVNSVYHDQFAKITTQLVQEARRYLPNTHIILEVGNDFYYSPTDPNMLSEVAAGNRCSLLMKSHLSMPARSYLWPMLGHACRNYGVNFGLRFSQAGRAESILGAFYSLSSEGGSMFVFDEKLLATAGAWKYYLNAVNNLNLTQPDRRVAVVFPKISVYTSGPGEFDRKIQQMRELFAFDVIDEAHLNQISASEYPLIFVPWGSVWSRSGIQNLLSLAREGAAVVVHTDKVWRTPNGDMSFNEKLFHAKLVQENGGWKYEPRSSIEKPYSSSPYSPNKQFHVNMGSSDSIPYISGDWSLPQADNSVRNSDFDLKNYRWMGKQGSIRLPVAPNRDYTLYIEGYMPEGKLAHVYMNGEEIDTIEGEGKFVFKRNFVGGSRPKQRDIRLDLQGETWSSGEVMGVTQSFQPSMAVSRVAMLPYGEQLGDSRNRAISQPTPDFRREALRGSWLKEVGRGVTVIAPQEYVSEWVFMELLNSVVQNPKILDPRFNFTLPVDGKHNGVYVSPQRRATIYVNLTSQTVPLPVSSESNRAINIPPMDILYTN